MAPASAARAQAQAQGRARRVLERDTAQVQGKEPAQQAQALGPGLGTARAQDRGRAPGQALGRAPGPEAPGWSARTAAAWRLDHNTEAAGTWTGGSVQQRGI